MENIQDGTLVRAASPTPGPMGLKGNLPLNLGHRKAKRRPSRKGLPDLRIGARGKDVRWLQALLNQHKVTQPQLKVDGYFGPKTQAAVISFQRAGSLSPDGVVGKQTWLKVVLPERRPRQTRVTQVSVTVAASVADWPLGRRFEEVLQLAPRHMRPELGAQFRAMLTPANLEIMAGTLAVWAVSHAFGAGEVADVGLLALGLAFVGLASFKAGEDLGDCVLTTLNAEALPDLDRAAEYLAQAVAILGVVAFFALVARVGAKFARGAGAGEENAAVAAAKPVRAPKTSVVDDIPEPASESGVSVGTEAPSSEPELPQATKTANGFADGTIPSSQRQQMATEWYAQHDPETAPSRAAGYDPEMPMEIKTLQPGDRVAQWVRNDGKPGIDFTTPSTDPSTLGLKVDPETGLPVGRHLEVYEVTKPIQVLQGKAGDFPDGVASLVGGNGGGDQIAMPPGWQNSLKRVQ